MSCICCCTNNAAAPQCYITQSPPSAIQPSSPPSFTPSDIRRDARLRDDGEALQHRRRHQELRASDSTSRDSLLLLVTVLIPVPVPVLSLVTYMHCERLLCYALLCSRCRYRYWSSKSLSITVTAGDSATPLPSHPLPSHPLPSHPLPSHHIPSYPDIAHSHRVTVC